VLKEKTMFNSGTNHHQVVKDALIGRRPVDEQVLTCHAILEDRLERLKKLGPQFAGVDFSPAAKRLTRRQSAVVTSL
jgi:hypothetical protein